MVIDIDERVGGIVVVEESGARRIGIENDHRIKSAGTIRSRA